VNYKLLQKNDTNGICDIVDKFASRLVKIISCHDFLVKPIYLVIQDYLNWKGNELALNQIPILLRPDKTNGTRLQIRVNGNA